jgi:succinyl-CoA synthetase beta subunit
VAEGILKALEQFPKWNIPIVIRLSGTNEERARELLKGTQLIPAATMSEGARKAVELSKR